MADLYQVQGVSHDVTPRAIRRAYLELVRANRPDLHPGNKVAEETFKAVATAFGVVGDEKKRGTHPAKRSSFGLSGLKRQH